MNTREREKLIFIRIEYNTKKTEKVQLLYCSANQKPGKNQETRVVNPRTS